MGGCAGCGVGGALPPVDNVEMLDTVDTLHMAGAVSVAGDDTDVVIKHVDVANDVEGAELVGDDV